MGLSGSPLILGDTVYLDIGNIVALNKTDGKEQWATKIMARRIHARAMTFKGKDYLVVFPATGLYVIERDKSKEVAAFKPWKTSYDVHAATPVVIKDKFIFMSSDYNVGCAGIHRQGSTRSGRIRT